MHPLAVLSDIHGNRWALEAVLEDIDRRGITNIVNLGDSLYGPLDPPGTASILEPMKMMTVCGNEDRIIYDQSVDVRTSPTLQFVRENLKTKHIDWLRSLKPVESIRDEILLFHGTPANDQEYLLYSVRQNALIRKTKKEIGEQLQHAHESLFLCGHDHLPNVIQLSKEKLIVNPGSVGLQAYEDDTPFYHTVEHGSPHARYCLIFKEYVSWRVEQVAVHYDSDTASEMAKRNHRLDWHLWLKTGYVT